MKIDKPETIDLKKIPTEENGGLQRDEGEIRAKEFGKELDELEDLLFYAGTHSLLIVLQGMDTSGKDGTIRHLLGLMNGQSCKVASFKVPTPEERARDFLWRVHAKVPGRGEVTIFNRSHYEDVGVVRVHNLAPEEVWKARFGQINEFESLLAANKTIIVKFFLHISKDEQEKRLLEREQEVEKSWKLSVNDWREREHWDAYQTAYSDAIGRCAQEQAPWHVVPADKKWYRNLYVTQTLVEALRPFRKQWLESLEETGRKAKEELALYRMETQQP